MGHAPADSVSPGPHAATARVVGPLSALVHMDVLAVAATVSASPRGVDAMQEPRSAQQVGERPRAMFIMPATCCTVGLPEWNDLVHAPAHGMCL